MSPKLINLYINSYLPGYLDFEGIKLIPTLKSNDNKILWTLENPSDLSYSKPAIKDFVYDSFELFNKFVSSKAKFAFTDLWHTFNTLMDFSSIDESYFSDEMNERLNSASRQIRHFSLRFTKLGFYDFEVEVIEFDFDFRYSDEIILSAQISIDSCYDVQNKVFLDNEDIRELLYKMNGEFDLLYDKTNILLDPISDIIWNTPTLCDRGTMYINVSSEYFDMEGETIET
jgi:hypothetical protein